MSVSASADDFRQRLGRLDAGLISDALDRLGLSGVVTGISRLSTDRTVAGCVVTVKLDSADGRAAARHLATGAIEAGEPENVIVIEHRARADCAGWGGILSCAARERNLAGVIIDGMCRDVDESRRLDFPVFARGALPATARGRVIETGFNVPVTIGDVTVSPGDWVLADGSGVVFLAALNAERILEVAEELALKEASMLAAIQAGTPVSQVMAGNYESMLKGK